VEIANVVNRSWKGADMTGTIWWLWLGSTGLGFLLIFAQYFYAIQKSFGIFDGMSGRKKHGRFGWLRLPSAKLGDDGAALQSPRNVGGSISHEDKEYKGNGDSSETESEICSDILDRAPDRPQRWVRACSCEVRQYTIIKND
jgi:hypothetical protein